MADGVRVKKTITILSPVIIGFLVVYATFNYFKKDLKQFLLSQIEIFSQRNLPFTVKGKNIHFNFYSASVQLTDLELTVNTKEDLGLSRAKIDNIRVNIDFLQILAGKIYLSSIVVESSDIQFSLDPYISNETQRNPEINWNPFFQLIKKIPVYRLAIIKSKLAVDSKKINLSGNFNDLDLIFFNDRESLSLKLNFSESTVHWNNKIKLPFHLQIDLTLSNKSIEIHQAELSAANSKIELYGEIKNLKNIMTSPEGFLKFKSELALAGIKDLFVQTEKHMPVLGSLAFSGDLQIEKGLHFKSDFAAQGLGLKIGQHEIGNINFKGKYFDKKITIAQANIENLAGDIKLSNLESEFESFDKITFKTNLDTEQIDMHELLLRQGIGDLPLEFFLAANIGCEGLLRPLPDIECRGQVQGEEFEVASGTKKEDLVIAAWEQMAAEGSFKITNHEITYKADLKVKENKGFSEGVISYKDGFRIKFASPRLDFKNLQKLANLKLEGYGSIVGETSGDSGGAKFNMNLDLNDLYFENFYLHKTKGNLSYLKGFLNFDNVSGYIGTTKYSAHVHINLSQGTISAEGQAPALELADVLKVIQRKVQLPFEVTGYGSAFVKLEGPLKLNQLSYTFSAQSFRGSIAGESYDRIHFDISAKNGEVKADKVLLTKNKSVISMFGLGHPDGNIDLSIRGDRFLLEESENISKISSNISGIFNYQIGLTGHVLSPDLNFKGSINNLIIEELDLPNSNFEFLLNKESLEGKASLLGQRLKSEFKIPVADNIPFYLKVDANEWNYATLVALIGGTNLLNDYQTSMTGTIELASESGGLFNASGKGITTDFLLKRGNLSLSNKGPMELIMKNGTIQLVNNKLISLNTPENNFLEISGSQFSLDDLNLKIEGKSELRLFQIFLPFMEEFSGGGKISAAVSGSIFKPEILGSAKIENGFAKIKGFPHPLERAQADVQFSAAKILINSVQGSLGGGTFKGDGLLTIEGPKNLPLNLSTKVENVTLNLPDGIKTTGDAELTFSGSWFPFLLSGTYRVRSGLIDMEFTDNSNLATLKQSSYLPKIILQSAFDPLTLDILINMDQNIAIKNSLIEGNLTGILQIKGTTSNPNLNGKISLDKSSRLLFRDKVFEIQAGNIQFKDPSEINPELFLSARSRVNDYDVFLLTQGTAKNPLLRWTSVPPLSENDIISLLALGVIAGKTDSRIQNFNDNQTSVMTLGSALISNTKAGKTLQEKLGVNVQLSSSYDDTKNVSVSKITLSKKLSNNVNASASRVQGQSNSNEYKLRYNFNSNISAVGTYEQRQNSEDTKSPASINNNNIFGIDLEFKKEFK